MVNLEDNLYRRLLAYLLFLKYLLLEQFLFLYDVEINSTKMMKLPEKINSSKLIKSLLIAVTIKATMMSREIKALMNRAIFILVV